MKTIIPIFTLLFLCLFACRRADRKTTGSADYQKALAFLDHQNDSAFFYFNKVVTNGKDRMETAVAYNYMGRLQSEAGDFFGGQESLLQSLHFLDKANKDDWWCLSSDYNELGLISISLKNYGLAPDYFDQAFKFTEDSSARLSFLNNKALAYQKMGHYPAALAIYRSTITQIKRKETYARVLSNMARTKWLQNRSYQAAPELLKALNIRQKANDMWGQNASFIHLSDYYASIKPDSGLYFARQEYAVATRLKTPDDQLEALERLIKLGPASETKTLFTQYRALNDSLTTARGAAKNQFALIRYEVEKNKADNLNLQQENTTKRTWIIVIVSIFSLITVIGIRFYRRRKRKQELATQFAVLETQHKVSKKVHDTLANDIYRILKRVQNDPVLEKNWLEEQVTEAYELARDLSYEIKMDPDEFFAEKIAKLLGDFSNEDTSVVIKGCEKEWWQKISVAHRAELKYVLQELMVNMRKHSRATEVIVRFEMSDQELMIDYSDDGIGLRDHQPGNGLKNTGNRINEIGGQITFANNAGRGLEIKIALPAV